MSVASFEVADGARIVFCSVSAWISRSSILVPFWSEGCYAAEEKIWHDSISCCRPRQFVTSTLTCTEKNRGTPFLTIWHPILQNTPKLGSVFMILGCHGCCDTRHGSPITFWRPKNVHDPLGRGSASELPKNCRPKNWSVAETPPLKPLWGVIILEWHPVLHTWHPSVTANSLYVWKMSPASPMMWTDGTSADQRIERMIIVFDWTRKKKNENRSHKWYLITMIVRVKHDSL